MARLVYKFKRRLRGLLKDAANDLVSLTQADDKRKAKDPLLAVFSAPDRTAVDAAIVVLDNAFTAQIPR